MNILKKSSKFLIAILLVFSLLTMYIYYMSIGNNRENIEVNKSYYGFKVVEEKALESLNSKAIIFQHIKSGAKIVYLKNDNENRVFSINFYTPPSNDTGINHIIEHSILNGSQKYPVKSLISEIKKNTVSSYINGKTCSDRTEYTFQTNNEVDFNNLLNVYMNSIFYPSFIKNSYIFSQEGWHYDIDSLEGDLKFNGVIYNEMKEKNSSLHSILKGNIIKSLFPDTSYQYISGGTTEGITKTSNEKAIEVYNRYYHPSNSYLYLYGSINILDTLKVLDENYLSKFDIMEIKSTNKLQSPFTNRIERVSNYSINKEESTNNKTYISVNYGMKNRANKNDIIGMIILKKLLESPLKKEMNKQGITVPISVDFDTSDIAQPIFMINLSSLNIEDKEKIQVALDNSFRNIIKSGFDKNSVESTLNSIEFNVKEHNLLKDRGLDYISDVMDGWLYNNNPYLYLDIQSSLDMVKQQYEKNYFEKLIDKNFLNNNYSSIVILKPIKDYDTEKNNVVKKDLNNYKSKISLKELNNLININKKFKEWQMNSNSSEELKSLPMLKKTDIDTNVAPDSINIDEINGVKILNSAQYTSEITYLDFYFDAKTISQEKIKYITLLVNILSSGSFSTEKYSTTSLNNAIENVGKLSIFLNNIQGFKLPENYWPKVNVSLAVHSNKLEQSLDIIDQVLNKGQVMDKISLKNILYKLKINEEKNYYNNLQNKVIAKAQLYKSEYKSYNEEQAGEEFYKFICDLYNDFDLKWQEINSELSMVSKLLFNKNNLIISMITDKNSEVQTKNELNKILNKLNTANNQIYNYNFSNNTKRQGIIIPSELQYIAQAGNIKKIGYDYNGKMIVLQEIISSDYLWKELREKNGVYSTKFSVSIYGDVIFYSERDPNIQETLNIFSNTPEFIKTIESKNQDYIDNYIVRALGKNIGAMSPKDKVKNNADMYISGISEKEKQQIINELLSTTVKDISAYSIMLKRIIDKNSFCVIGNSKKIQTHKHLFEKIDTLLSEDNN